MGQVESHARVDLRLRDAGEFDLDWVFERGNAFAPFIAPRQLAQTGVRGGRFAAAGRADDQDRAEVSSSSRSSRWTIGGGNPRSAR